MHSLYRTSHESLASDHLTPLQRRHARQSEIPSVFAEATLAASIRDANTAAKEAARAQAARKVARLIRRGEL